MHDRTSLTLFDGALMQDGKHKAHQKSRFIGFTVTVWWLLLARGRLPVALDESAANGRTIRASGKVGGGNEVSWPPSHWLECESCGESVLNDFWAVTYDERDVEQYKRFIEMLRLRKEGLYGPVIG